jgi:hypothetical protein
MLNERSSCELECKTKTVKVRLPPCLMKCHTVKTYMDKWRYSSMHSWLDTRWANGNILSPSLHPIIYTHTWKHQTLTNFLLFKFQIWLLLLLMTSSFTMTRTDGYLACCFRRIFWRSRWRQYAPPKCRWTFHLDSMLPVVCYIWYIRIRSSLHNLLKTVDTNELTFVFILLLTLHVSALISGHHQAYSDTSLSSWTSSNSNMDPYCVLKSVKMHKSSL